MQRVDSVIHARWVVPIRPAASVLEHHAVAIDDGAVVALAPSADLDRHFEAGSRQVLASHALIPGLVNAHTHAAMSLLRGLADDLPLTEWLEGHVWPTESRVVSEGFVRDGTRLAVLEMIRGGTTCFNDMYFFPDETARVAEEAGIRATVGLIVLDVPTVWAGDADEYITKGIEVHDGLRNHPLVRTAFAPHAPYTVSDGPLARVRTLAEEMDVPVHMHVHETADEVRQSVARFGRRPLARLDALGLLGPRLVAVHMTALEPVEMDRVADCGAHVVHCPESNMKLASGLCPAAALRAAGVNVAIGTDGAASNNDLDMIGETRSAALLGKAVAQDARALTAHEALAMATLGGARALGREHEIGTIEPGRQADLVAVDLDAPETQPVYEPVSQIVYAAARGQVSDVWVAGRQLLRARAAITVDEDAVRARASTWRERIAGGAAP